MASSTTLETASAAIADLQGKWAILNDLDRARAVHQIHRAGVSYRKLAKALNSSESLLRHLNKAAQAPALDQILARKGKISTRELVRRSKAAEAARASKAQEALECERNLASKKVRKAICGWLEEEGFPGAYGEQIVDEELRKLH
jgi:transposase